MTWAEAENELNGPSANVYAMLDKVRTRVGMPAVDQSKYNTKDKLRELIRRERGSEFAGEGLVVLTSYAGQATVRWLLRQY